MNLTYGSVCSGIEAATVAWHELGWKPAWFSQFDPEHDYKRGLDYPSQLLKHHYPDVPNLGDMTKIADQVLFGDVEAPDVLVGGTPCQAFSVAGLRQSMDDTRGQLTLSYVNLANSIDKVRIENGKEPVIIVWENVPGVLSTKDNAFGCFLTALSGEEVEFDAPRDSKGRAKRWPNSGCVFGPQRVVSWRILDAQYFGVAQRRKRVFVVASAREGFHPAQVLLEFNGLRRDIAPSRGSGAEVAGTITSSSFAGGASGKPEGVAGGHFRVVTPYTPSSFANYVNGVGILKSSGGDLGGGSEAVLTEVIYCEEITSSLCAVDGPKGVSDQYAHEGKIIAMAHGQASAEITEDFAPTLSCNHEQPIIFNSDAMPDQMNFDNHTTPTLTVSQHAAVCIPINTMTMMGRPSDEINPRMGLGIGSDGDPMNTLTSAHSHAVAYGLKFCDSPIKTVKPIEIRRLIPVECERLQGFPDGYTNIGTEDKPTADTHRYKALGNSMAVPVMNWVGRRIEYALKRPWE